MLLSQASPNYRFYCLVQTFLFIGEGKKVIDKLFKVFYRQCHGILVMLHLSLEKKSAQSVFLWQKAAEEPVSQAIKKH